MNKNNHKSKLASARALDSTSKLTLDYPPSLNRMYRMVNGRFLISEVGRDYKKLVGDICLVNRLSPLSGQVCIRLDAYRPAKRGDLDNLFKVLLDSIKGYCYHDDKQIVEMHAYRRDDKANPRVEVEITEV
jgi:crossover junction endodeoxyribonuclease RusA